MYLNTHSYFSLRYGTYSPQGLLELAQKNKVKRFVLSDINNTSGCLSILRQAPKYDCEPLLGVDFRNGVDQKFIAIAKNNSGFEEINRFLSSVLHLQKGTGLKVSGVPESAPDFKHAFVVYPFRRGKTVVLKENEFLGVSYRDLDHIRLKKLDTTKAVILHTASFRNKKDFNAHRLLRAIDNNTLLSKLPESEQGLPDDKMLPVDELLQLFRDFPEIIENTRYILDNCSIFFDFSDDAKPQNKKHYTDSAQNDLALLTKLCHDGLKYRYPEAGPEIMVRVKKELDTIDQMGFVSYFLINWDIVSYAQRKGYFYVGRGSGANSIVSYLLRITDVDPVELDLYFERFINLYRVNPPDFDIDFSWRDREDITRYVFTRFDNVALVATYTTFQAQGVRRELGKVFGLPKEEIDKLGREYIHPQEVSELGQLVISYGQYIHGFPGQLSIHASGIVIAEKPIEYFSATFLPQKGYPTVQFDMHVAEDVGLYKFDILSQRGLGKIRETIEIIQQTRPDEPPIDIHDLKRFKQDERIRKMLREAKAIGCFYVESPAMRMLLRKLRVDDYLGLVAASSVIRPGVAQSGMMQTYIQRFRNPEKRKEAHPVLLKLMPETYGVMVYQEDVIKVAHHFAGLTLGEADKMRRGMSGKYRSREEFQQVKEKFFSNCRELMKHSDELTAEVWRQTESFAGYAFAKGHSASYAVESYQSLFLKAYYPLEYMVATVNNYGGFYRTELYLLEARLYGGTILPTCVNRSFFDTTLYGKDIFIGFHLLQGFETLNAEKIVEERLRNGLFTDFNDFINRLDLSLEQLSILIRINAFRFTQKSKRTLLWEAHLKLNKESRKNSGSTAAYTIRDLFRVQRQEYNLPSFEQLWQEDAFDQIELLGFSLYSIFELLTADDTPGVLAEDLPRHIGEKVWIKGYLIHRKTTTTRGGQRMCFGTFIDRQGHWLDSIHFPDIAKKYPFRGTGVYKVFGKVVEDYDCIHIEAEYMERMAMMEDPRYRETRDDEKEKQVVTRNRRVSYRT